MKNALLAFSLLLVAVPVYAGDCGWIVFGIGTYDDNSELEASATYCSPSGSVVSCELKPACYPGQDTSSLVLNPGDRAQPSTWSGVGPCQAVISALSFTCPFNLSAAPQPLTPITSGPDVQNP